MIDVDNIKLEYRDIEGAGKQIRAVIGQPVNCIEFTMKGDVSQSLIQTPKEPATIAYEPWIQFEPEEWSDMLEKIMSELVSLWNSYHGKNMNSLVDKSSVSKALRTIADHIEYQFYTKEQVINELNDVFKRLEQWK